MQNSMRTRYKKLLSASDKEGNEGVDDLWAQFQLDFGNKPFTTYLKRYWFSEGEIPKWQLWFRQGFPDLNTNNLLESWHKTLKKHYLRNERNVRPDYLIWMLNTAMDIDIRVEYYSIRNGLQAPRLSMLTTFIGRHRSDAQILALPEAEQVNDVPDDNPEDIGFALHHAIESTYPAVKQLLDVERFAREEEEERRRQLENEEAMRRCDEDINKALDKLNGRMKRRRVCCLAKRQEFAALLQRVCHEARELYDPGAGRICQ
ncbi:hypothetical protein BGW42_005252 [Actinomortierella wolfii]|nr:hypothetical protein BGW42_005252 [Actinomortierella wolfii]